MVSSLILHEKIQTTETKAKELRRVMDKMMTLAKQNTLESKRRLLGQLTEKNAVKKIRTVLVPRYQERTSGFTRIIRLGQRKGDSATVVNIELV